MSQQDYENKKLVITKFSFFLQMLNSNFRLSANKAYIPIIHIYVCYFSGICCSR